MRLIVLALLVLAAAVSGRRHRYGMHGSRTRQQGGGRRAIDTPRMVGHDRQVEQEFEEGAEEEDDDPEQETLPLSDYDNQAIESIMRSTERTPRRPDAINPEPYIALGGLWLSAQIFR